MEFNITCPIDGTVDVSLEDIDSVVLRDSDRADITFVCPHCGTEISVSAIVPSFLLSAIEALAENPENPVLDGLVVVSGSDASAVSEIVRQPVPAGAVESDGREEAYCEYFRRQLDSISCVEDALSEMDSRG